MIAPSSFFGSVCESNPAGPFMFPHLYNILNIYKGGERTKIFRRLSCLGREQFAVYIYYAFVMYKYISNKIQNTIAKIKKSSSLSPPLYYVKLFRHFWRDFCALAN